jgi:hypothetical protein
LGFVIVPIVFDVFLLQRFGRDRCDWWSASARTVWLEKIPFFGVAGVVLGITLWLRFNVTSQWTAAASLDQFGPGHRLMQAFYIWAYYLWKPILPFALSPAYTTLISFNPWSAAFLGSAGVVVLLSAVLFWRRKQRPGPWALWLCYLVYQVPVLGLTEHPHFPNDRYSLGPGILLSLLIAGGLYQLANNRRRFLWGSGITAGVIAVCGVLGRQQTAVWRDTKTLYEHVLRNLGNHPYAAAVYWRWALERVREGQPDSAVAALRAAVVINPNDPAIHALLAKTCFDLGKLDEARRHYVVAVNLAPDDTDSHNGLGAVFAAEGNWEAASEHFLRSLRLNPNLARASFNLGLARLNQGRTNEAKIYFERAARLERLGARPK